MTERRGIRYELSVMNGLDSLQRHISLSDNLLFDTQRQSAHNNKAVSLFHSPIACIRVAPTLLQQCYH